MKNCHQSFIYIGILPSPSHLPGDFNKRIEKGIENLYNPNCAENAKESIDSIGYYIVLSRVILSSIATALLYILYSFYIYVEPLIGEDMEINDWKTIERRSRINARKKANNVCYLYFIFSQ